MYANLPYYMNKHQLRNKNIMCGNVPKRMSLPPKNAAPQLIENFFYEFTNADVWPFKKLSK